MRAGASKRKQRAHKAPKGGGRGVGRNRARAVRLLGAVKATSDAGLKPSSQLTLGAASQAKSVVWSIKLGMWLLSLIDQPWSMGS